MSALGQAEIAALADGGLDLAGSDLSKYRQLTNEEIAAALGPSLSVREVAARLQISASEVRDRIRERTLMAVRLGRDWQIPDFQFVGGEVVAGLDTVLRALPGDLHPVAAVGWLSGPDPDLEIGDAPVSPLTWLKAGGDPTRAAAIAEHL